MHYEIAGAHECMATVAEHVNEMQRVHEEFGAAFDELARLYRQHRAQLLGLKLNLSLSHSLNLSRSAADVPCAPEVTPAIELSVGEMLMYGAVEWLNAHEYELCALRDGARLAAVVFVFRSALVIFAMERGSGSDQSTEAAGCAETTSALQFQKASAGRKKSGGTAAAAATGGAARKVNGKGGNGGRSTAAKSATGSLGNLNDSRLFTLPQNGSNGGIGGDGGGGGLRNRKNASGSSELVAKSASRVSLVASSMRFQTVVPVSELQVATCDALSTPDRFVWQLIHRRPAFNSSQPAASGAAADAHAAAHPSPSRPLPNNRPLERVYLLANATAAVREQFLRVIAHTLATSAPAPAPTTAELFSPSRLVRSDAQDNDNLQHQSGASITFSEAEALCVESGGGGVGVGGTNGFRDARGRNPLWRFRESAKSKESAVSIESIVKP